MLVYELINRFLNPPKWFACVETVRSAALRSVSSDETCESPARHVPNDLLRDAKEVSNGHYGKVFIFDDYAVKVCLDPDDGAIAFLEWVKKHPNKHFPTVYYTQNKGGVFIAIMGKLSPLTRIGGVGAEREDERTAFRSVALWGGLPAECAEWPTLQKAAVMLSNSGLLGHFYSDLHEYNWMKREDGTLVCNDPFAGRAQ